MPGIDLILYKTVTDRKEVPRDHSIIYNNDFLSISTYLPYPNYPVADWQTEEYLFVVEGFFFEWDDWQQKVEQFASAFFTSGYDARLADTWFANIDAEFILIVSSKSQERTFVFTDILGRFPLYVCHSEKHLILSRNLALIHCFQSLTPNAQALLETLALGFSIGSKTVYNEIDRVPGGTVVEASKNSIRMMRYHELNYELMIDNAINNSVIHEIKSLFIEGIRQRIKPGDLNIVALSGGLDSRAVAGGFELAGLPYKLVSYSDQYGYADHDNVIAKQIARNLGKQVEIVDLPPPEDADFDLYFRLKYGVNALDMTYLLNFYRYLVKLPGNAVLFTGDGGDKVFPDLRPPAFIRSPDAVVNYAIRSNAKMNLRDAAAILDTDGSKVFAEIVNQMESYPETSWRLKYVHFIMDNRVANWLTEGEDRNRCFLQSFTPFYNLKLFRKLMTMPFSAKQNFSLYRSFLREIAPATFQIPNANWGFAITRKDRIRWTYLKQSIKMTGVGNVLKNIVQQSENRVGKKGSYENDIFERLRADTDFSANFRVSQMLGTRNLNLDNLLHLMTLHKVSKVAKPI